jgi:uncharacterized protein YegL
MKKNYTDITLLLDRSGSMAGTKADTIGGVNTFIEDQKKEEGEAKFTLVQFATTARTDYTKDIKDVELLNQDTYQPTGASTAYLDALGKTINETGERLSALPDDERPEKVVVVVMTDGFENASREFRRGTIKEMIKHQEEKYNWQFVFMGANMDAVAEGSTFGVKSANAFTFVQDSAGLKSAYGALSSNLRSYRKGEVENMSFTPEQREEQEKDKKVSNTMTIAKK